MLITFEGIDGCGKTTQIKMLEERLKASRQNVLTTREPGWNTEVSGIMRHLILHGSAIPSQKLFLLPADRADHYERMILPVLLRAKGGVEKTAILCDRGIDSTVAYQGFGEQISDPRAIAAMNMVATKGIKPNLTFLLDIPVDLAKQRSKNQDYFEIKGPEFFHKVRNGYLEIASNSNGRIIVVDATQSVDDVSSIIVRETIEALGY